MPAPDYHQAQRERMVQRHIAARGIRDVLLLNAMRGVPREDFVPEALRDYAYEDSPLPIGHGQTISQPYIVALMLDAAGVMPGDRLLEVGLGSGYAAAVACTLGAKVFAIDRIPELVEAARDRLDRLGCEAVELMTGDGTSGWPEAAPFEIILAAAGGPAVPDALRQQLRIGGRLIIPIGSERNHQNLLRVTRTGEDSWREEDLGAVNFVPLIGRHGWEEEEGSAVRGAGPAGRTPEKAREGKGSDTDADAVALIRRAAEVLPDFDQQAFADLFERFALSKVVLLGECSHGTSEFYRARAAITRHLVREHGYRIVAIEADWPDAASLDRKVRGLPAEADDAPPPFRRFPTWMWRNREMDEFIDWLCEHNRALPPEQRTGIYGLDLYSLRRSIHAVISYLQSVDPDAAEVARARYGCLSPWSQDPAEYGRAMASEGFARCEQPVLEMLGLLLAKRVEYAASDGESFLDAAQNARLISNAESYYRAMYRGGADAWNIRDQHMFETLEALLEAQSESSGEDARAVVWAHNSHIGDARHTDMGRLHHELNLGQLCREKWGDQVSLIGFGTHTGTVAAADDWGDPMRIMQVQPSRPDSYEHLFHRADVPRCLVELCESGANGLHAALSPPRLERFIGVIYRPHSERYSHYAKASLSQQFDAYVWFNQTHAVDALAEESAPGIPDTFPFGE